MNNLKKIINSPWAMGVQNIALILLIYTICRLFYYLISLDLYPNVTTGHLLEMMIGGLRFDITALFYLNSVYMALMFLPLPWRTERVYQRVAQWFYLIPNGLGIIANCVDMVYVRFSARRTTMAFFAEFQNDDNLGTIAAQAALQYWYVTLFGITMLAAMILFSRHRCVATPLQEKMMERKNVKSAVWFYLHGALLFALSIYFVVIGIRSGFGSYTRPITLSNALQYTNTPAETNIVLNTPFCLMRSTEGKAYTRPNFMSDEEMTAIMTPYHPADTTAVFTPKNVVILILESMSKEYIGFYNKNLDGGTYQGYTPFLDSLIAQSVTYQYSYSSGRKSIDAMPSVLASIPRIGTPYILTPYSTNEVSSIALYLGQKGYETGFFHGAPNGSMGFLAFSRSCGFQKYYGKSEYGNDADYDGTWAIWDEEFLQYYALTMSEMKEPFMTSVFTATSHHPFHVPARYEGVFPEGTAPIHHCIGYVDMALRRLFETAKQQPWYANTLFVLVADHTNELTHQEYRNDKGVYEVPIVFFDPSKENNGRLIDTYPVCQADIEPSILAYLGYDEAFNSFGEDALTKAKENPYVVVYNEPVYQVFSDSLMVQVDQNGHILNVYDLRTTDENGGLHKIDTYPQETDKMVLYLKAYVQQYLSRMMDNRLTVE